MPFGHPRNGAPAIPKTRITTTLVLGRVLCTVCTVDFREAVEPYRFGWNSRDIHSFKAHPAWLCDAFREPGMLLCGAPTVLTRHTVTLPLVVALYIRHGVWVPCSISMSHHNQVSFLFWYPPNVLFCPILPLPPHRPHSRKSSSLGHVVNGLITISSRI